MRRAAIAVLLAAGACSAETVPLCPDTAINVDGLCRARCSGPFECLIGEMCTGGACVPDGVGPPDAGQKRDAGEPEDSGVPERCDKDIDCGPSMFTEWSVCGEFGDTCDETGSEQRDVKIARCKDGTCELFFDVERRDCTVSKAGMECGRPVKGEWTECAFDDECVTAGMRRRSVSLLECDTGACVPRDDVEVERCVRGSTEGDGCAPYNDTVTGPCVAADCTTAPAMDAVFRAWTCVNERCEPHETGGEAIICGPGPAPEGTPCGNGMQCCNFSCRAVDDPEHCGVCGVNCANNRGCVALPLSGGSTHYACECEAELECFSYGVNGGCVATPGNTGVCSCGCIGGAMSCSGPCASGSCYMSMLAPFGYCAYP